MTIDAVTPNDTKYDSLWGLPAIKVPQAWEYEIGANNVYVAVVDSGVDYTHADIKDNFENKGYSGNYSLGNLKEIIRTRTDTELTLQEL